MTLRRKSDKIWLRMENMMVLIEPLDIAEVDLLEPLVDEFASSHDALSFRPDYQAAFRDWIRRISTNPEKIIYIAKDDSQIIGFAVGLIEENGPLILPDRIGYIPMLVVSSRFRRKGVGKRLWVVLNDWFSSKGVNEVQLNTHLDNEIAQNFWDHFGFKPILERRRIHIK